MPRVWSEPGHGGQSQERGHPDQVLDEAEVAGHGHDAALHLAPAARVHGHQRALLGKVERHAGKAGRLHGLLAEPPFAKPRPGGVLGPGVGGPPGQIGPQAVQAVLSVRVAHATRVQGTQSSVGPPVTDCLFCKIVAGEVPSEEVASSAGTYAFRDNNPQAPTHVLVVPRQHVTDASRVGPEHAEVLAEMMTTAQQVAGSEGIDHRGYRLVLNVGEDALNSVPHLHLHVLGGRRFGWPPG